MTFGCKKLNFREDYRFPHNFVSRLIAKGRYRLKTIMASLSSNKEAEIIQAFNSISRYLVDILNIDNPYFEDMVGQIYPPE